ncbi:hypothetical protein GUJ93_ZPchr0006g42269 [Zizania palustris]|uniref:Uncharacterized protein n=1 Tax=Zizania palustris TaxID=103762 RepID=A0A8J5T3A4_ZIZPA|nr:hypothetical protein GUJ93_ZPchr0006g42269 [Zizania palustris]
MLAVAGWLLYSGGGGDPLINTALAHYTGSIQKPELQVAPAPSTCGCWCHLQDDADGDKPTNPTLQEKIYIRMLTTDSNQDVTLSISWISHLSIITALVVTPANLQSDLVFGAVLEQITVVTVTAVCT